jgi:Asp-tRNA(Asn)/Glu-tRNA(Gln) amidotransferase C subunit
MAQNIAKYIKTLEKLSLVTCSNEVLALLQRSLNNIEPILKVDTKGVEPLLWQNELSLDRLYDDQSKISLTKEDLKKNAKGFYEDYIVVGILPKDHNKTENQ